MYSVIVVFALFQDRFHCMRRLRKRKVNDSIINVFFNSYFYVLLIFLLYIICAHLKLVIV